MRFLCMIPIKPMSAFVSRMAISSAITAMFSGDIFSVNNLKSLFTVPFIFTPP